MTMKREQRDKILASTLKEIQSQMPDNIVGRYKDIGKDIDVEVLSTGSISVDAAIGGGFPKGRLINLVGHTSSGKTTLALTAIAKEQAKNPDVNVLYVDAEFALDPNYVAALGVNLDDLIICQPSSGEDGYKTVELFMNSGIADIVVIDSIAAMLPKAMLEREYDKEAQPGAFSKLTSVAIGRINRLANQYKCTVILINQWKPVVKINQFAAVSGAMGNWYQPGGAQMPFFCSQILEIKRSGQIKEGKELKSNIITMTNKKNKIAPPYRTADFVITYGVGLDEVQELISLGMTLKEIAIAGSFYSFPNIPSVERSFQGRINLANELSENKELFEELKAIILDHVSGARDIRIAEEARGEAAGLGPDEEEI